MKKNCFHCRARSFYAYFMLPKIFQRNLVFRQHLWFFVVLWLCVTEQKSKSLSKMVFIKTTSCSQLIFDCYYFFEDLRFRKIFEFLILFTFLNLYLSTRSLVFFYWSLLSSSGDKSGRIEALFLLVVIMTFRIIIDKISLVNFKVKCHLTIANFQLVA